MGTVHGLVARSKIALLVVGLLVWSGAAGAEGGRRLQLVALPSLGPNTPVADGWSSCVVHLTNSSDLALSGTIELVNQDSPAASGGKHVALAPFFLPPSGRVALELPARGGFRGAPQALVARALDEEGRLLEERPLPERWPRQPLLFDLDVPSRIAPALRGLGLPARRSRSLVARDAQLLAVSSPEINAKTGDAVLPVRANGYSSVTVLLARSETLAKINGTELEALVSWVLAGGVLAVVPTRPEDLRGRLLVALIGGEVARASAPAELANASDEPMPSVLVTSELTGYSGGNLHQSRWGASASYGLGEVHLLAFDATREPFTSDDWVKHKLIDLIAHAWQRRSLIALPYAQTALDVQGLDRIRRQLDPNQGTRWVLVASSLALVIYLVCVGPGYLPRSKRRIWRSPWLLPVWLLLGFGAIVALGVVAKGVLGRARRLTLVEAGSGMPRAAATRFRGFFTRSAEALSVCGSERNSVLDVTGDDPTERRLLVARDGPCLEKIRAEPWHTLVVREDGFIALGGGIGLSPVPGGDIAIQNRLARDLLGVVIKPPGKDAVLLQRVRDGHSVLASQGEKLAPSIGGKAPTSDLALHRLGAEFFAEELNRAASGLGDSWRAFESLTPDVDWWPNDVPVLIAQIEGGEGSSVDSGVELELDRVLIRVVGWGGKPALKGSPR